MTTATEPIIPQPIIVEFRGCKVELRVLSYADLIAVNERAGLEGNYNASGYHVLVKSAHWLHNGEAVFADIAALNATPSMFGGQLARMIKLCSDLNMPIMPVEDVPSDPAAKSNGATAHPSP